MCVYTAFFYRRYDFDNSFLFEEVCNPVKKVVGFIFLREGEREREGGSVIETSDFFFF